MTGGREGQGAVSRTRRLAVLEVQGQTVRLAWLPQSETAAAAAAGLVDDRGRDAEVRRLGEELRLLGGPVALGVTPDKPGLSSLPWRPARRHFARM